LYKKLEELFCNYNSLKKINLFPNIRIIGCHHNNILTIPYLKTLQELYCDCPDEKKKIKISKKYEIEEAVKYDNIYKLDLITDK